VAQWNKTSASAKFRPGETIVVFLAQKAARRGTSAHASRPSAHGKHASSAKATHPSKAKETKKKAAASRKSAPAKEAVKKKKR